MSSLRPPRLLGAALACAVALGLAACGSDDDSPSTAGASGGETVKVGAIVSASGPRAYGAEASQGARAFFEAANADGGIAGHQIEYIVEDDGADPARAAAAARKLLQEDVVAIVGGASLVECQANDRLYQQRDITDLIALPSNPVCFQSPNIVPIISGPIQTTVSNINYAIDELGAKKIQFVAVDAPTGHSVDPIIQGYLDKKGVSAGPTEFLAPDQDPTPALVRIKRRNPDALVQVIPPQQAIGLLRASAEQGIGPADVPTLAGGVVYDDQFVDAVGKDADGLYASIDYRPLQAKPQPESMRNWLAAMDEHIPAEDTNLFLSQAGWISAEIFAEALSSIDGEVTAASVTEAIRAITDFDNGMNGNVFDLSPKDPPQAPNRSQFIVQVVDGEWTHIADYDVPEFPPADFEPPAPSGDE
ncbi:MAG: ABC transporter substrate-binding protein [Solirubrobacterales bacterium]|nr:ABC transporter substrate-binding protein [Solirubrobacterales bacterium]